MEQRKFSHLAAGSRTRLNQERRRVQILRSAELLFAATGFRSTRTAALASASGISEAMLYRHFSGKESLFEAVVERNAEKRLASLEDRLRSIPGLAPLDCITQLAEATILACAGADGNAAVMVWGLMETPQFAKEVYRAEIGATEAMWHAELCQRFGDSTARSRLAVHLVPYAVHACMSFGLWLAALGHARETAVEHARQYAKGIARAGRTVLDSARSARD